MVSDGIIQPRLRDRHRCALATRWMVAVAVALATLAAGIWGARTVRQMETRQKTDRHFREIALALQDYAECEARCLQVANGRLPFPVRRAALRQPHEATLGLPEQLAQRLYRSNGKGETLFSWRAEITPYLENSGAGLNRLKRWDEHPNREVLLWYSVYYSYGDDNGCQTGRKPFPDTNAMAVTGPGTAFGDLAHPPKSLADVPSGTILIVEAARSGVPWPAPGDFDVRTMPQTISASDGEGISSRCPGGFHVIFGDRQVWFLSNEIPFAVLKEFFTTDGAEKHDRETVLGPYALQR